MATSDSQLRANKKYHAKFEMVRIRVSPEDKEAIDVHAETIGESVNSFVRRAIFETIERDLEKKRDSEF